MQAKFGSRAMVPPTPACDRIDRYRCRRRLGRQGQKAKGRIHMRLLRRAGLGIWLGFAVAHSSQGAWAQAKTIKIVISVPPGGSIDFLVRVLADYLARTRGATIVVESRPGAGAI